MNKHIFFLLTFSFFFCSEIFSQVGGNAIYEQNNRYKQNKSYNEDAEQVWLNREDNAYNWTINPVKNDNEMIFTVNSLLNAKADSYLAIFSVVQSGKTVKEVNDLVNERINNFKAAILKLGVKEEDIVSDLISFVPVYTYNEESKLFSKKYIEVPSGFEMQKNIHIKYTNTAIFDDIMNAAANSEIYDLIKVEYFVENNDAKYTELRDKSVAYLKTKLKSFEQLGVKLDTVKHILNEKLSVVYPVDRYESYQAYTGTTVPSKGSVTNVRKPKTMFYNKLPYHKFDIVINPAVHEPAVQFTYSLTVKYILSKEKSKTEKIFYLVTPDGTIKQLPVK